MRRLLPPVLLALLLAACEGGLPPGPPAPTAGLRVGFGGIVDTITVDATERLPLRAAELVAPDGTATPASYINVVAAPSFELGQQRVANSWRDSLSGSGGGAVLGIENAQAGAAVRSREQILAVASTADIPLPDPVAYRRDWQHYHLRLTFGTPPGEVETREVPAPEPPPR